MARAGMWSWWADREQIIVGWLTHEQFGEDIPIVEVRDSRGANHLIECLDHVDAKPVVG